MNADALAEGGITAFLDPSLASLAREIAMDLQEVDKILAAHGLSREEFEKLQGDPTFTKLFQAAVTEWNAASSTPERIRLKAQVMVEESLPSLHTATVDDKIPLAQRVEALKFTSKLAALVDEKGGVLGGRGPVSGGFSISINIGSDTVKITQALPTPEVIDHVDE